VGSAASINHRRMIVKKSQLLRFIEIRNASGFSSNLQFSIDAGEAGFKVEELGEAFKLEAGGYRWWTEHGQLIEHPDGRCELR
jgi:hypothetical protein